MPTIRLRRRCYVTNGWKWKPVAQPPVRDAAGTLHFDDFPDFTPNKTPEELLREGSFGGGYFWPFRSRKLNLDGEHSSDEWVELPQKWCQGLDIKRYLTGEDNEGYAVHINKYKFLVNSPLMNGWLPVGFNGIAAFSKVAGFSMTAGKLTNGSDVWDRPASGETCCSMHT